MPFYQLRVVVLPLSWVVLTLEGRNWKNDAAVDFGIYKNSYTYQQYISI